MFLCKHNIRVPCLTKEHPCPPRTRLAFYNTPTYDPITAVIVLVVTLLSRRTTTEIKRIVFPGCSTSIVAPSSTVTSERGPRSLVTVDLGATCVDGDADRPVDMVT